MARVLNLYKVQAEEWVDPEFAVAANQMEAIENVSDIDSTQDPRKYSVSYIGDVYLQLDVVREEHILRLEEECAKQKDCIEKLRSDLQRICEGKLITVEQIKSVYAAAGICDQFHEKTDSDNLMALWATLKEWHKELTGKEE